jgi:O-antigen ligase
MGILKIFFTITILLLPLGEFGRYFLPQIGSTPLVVNDVLVGLVVLVWLGKKIVKKGTIQVKLWLPIIAFLGVCCLSLLVNSTRLTIPQLIVSSLYIVRWGIYAGLYFVVADFDNAFRQRILTLLLIAGQIVVSIGFLQFFFYPSLRNLYYLGWDEHLYRMFSVFLDPNFAGVFFVLVFLLTGGVVFKKIKEKKQIAAVVVGIFSVFDLIAVYLTYSRSALLMLLISIVVFLWLYQKKTYIIFSFIVLVFILFLSPKSFQTEGTNIFRIASTEARLTSAQDALDIAVKNPLLGVGFNAYRYAQYKYGYISGKYWVISHGGGSTDNSYLFILATTGVVGFLTYLFLIYQVSKVQKIALVKKETKILGIVTIASLIGLLVSAVFTNTLFYIFIMEWVWIVIGLTEST